MRFWFSSLPLPAGLIADLAAAGLEPWPSDRGSPNGGSCLLVYDSPERLIAAAAEAEEMFSSTALAQGYSQLLRCRESSGQPLLAGWRLQRVGSRELQQWLTSNTPTSKVANAEPIAPLVASVILSLLETQPLLLDAYSDLELQAELLGSEPDLHYRQRLGQAIAQADPLPQLLKALQNRDGELQDAREEAELTLLQLHQVQEELQSLQQELQPKVADLEQQLQSRDGELQDAREEAELTLLQLHQVQEELEHYFLADKQKQELLDSRNQEFERLQADLQSLQQELQPKVADLEQQLQSRDGELQDAREEAELTLLQLHQTQADIQALQQELQPKVANLEQQLQSRNGELQDAREEAELTLLQLHQVQEELEHYFLHSRACSQLVEAQTDQLKRAKRLLAKLPINAFSSHGEVAAVAVEVLPAEHQQGQPTSLQVQALLSTYASSLDRASALLAKAMQN